MATIDEKNRAVERQADQFAIERDALARVGGGRLYFRGQGDERCLESAVETAAAREVVAILKRHGVRAQALLDRAL